MSAPSLPALFGSVLKTTTKLAELPTMEDQTQELVEECLKNLRDLHSHIIDLSIFSPNETLEDISTRDLVYLAVPYVFAEVQGRMKTTVRVDRMNSLIQAERYIQNFIGLLEKYEIVPEDERTLFDRKTANVADFSKRRELKINQYKKERELKARIDTIRKRRRQITLPEDASSDFDLLASLLFAESNDTPKEEEANSETEEILRETTLLLLRLLYAHASGQLQSMEQELDLLRNAPPSPIMGPDEHEDERSKKRKEEASEWKLDVPVPGGPDGKGPLLDSKGKPLRPFTILPSDAVDRARLQAQVFGPGHRLPTMTIEEYLQIEKQRGNIITGGGAASQNAPTSSEKLANESEMDGTLESDLKSEIKRQKDENWARFTDENPKGAGNTMNRG
ncbi:hypothetical protein JR316_0003597 [Psilocybe cubensis]|uniref:TAP42-like protein n=2 Tax=Psilocybe cubensis TaxID=181762 RepID=A0A8H8CN88_PSICU|nr:hypothetical protein JR316_0003597 [Psilocybe cubensis]KAH9484117.1 hypothetical protein JR316_0003597 [Psilocybe cubensis]